MEVSNLSIEVEDKLKHQLNSTPESGLLRGKSTGNCTDSTCCKL
jgi:hypothetical protein